MCAPALAVLLATGCATQLMNTPNVYIGAPEDPWAELDSRLQDPLVEVIYATDRVPEGMRRGRLRYGWRRSYSLGYGTATVRLGDLSWPELVHQSRIRRRTRGMPIRVETVSEQGRFPDTPWKHIVLDGRRRVDPEVVAAHLAEQRRFREMIGLRLKHTPRKEAFVYIHGFNNSFEDAAMVIGELWHFLGREGVPISYSWPSGGTLHLRGYNYDRESGEFTVFHLKQFLETLAGTPELERIHLIAHSRGTDVLITALREMTLQYVAAAGDPAAARSALKLGHVVLAAPDIDYDVARQRLEAEPFDGSRAHLTIYTSPDDLAITIAKWLFASSIRLGTLGLAQLAPDDRLAIARLEGVSLIDARVSTDLIGHSYFYEHPAVSSDLILLLRYGLPPGDGMRRGLIRREDSWWELREGYPWR